MDDFTPHQGAELRLRPSGPMPPGAADHLRELFNDALTSEPPKLKIFREEIDSIEDPAIASAFVLAEQDLDELDTRFAIREEMFQYPQQWTATPSEDTALEELTEAVREVVRDAQALGVRFVVRVEQHEETAAPATPTR